MPDLFDRLNRQQRRAVVAGDGPVLIVAGPGTGKTRTLTERISHLMANGRTKPEQILALTFTKKAAAEMTKRLRETLNTLSVPNVYTFHALCHELLASDVPFVTEAQRLAIIKGLSRPQDLKGLSVRELGLLISRAKNEPETVRHSRAGGNPVKKEVDSRLRGNDAMDRSVKAYNQALAGQGLRDFDDLLLETYDLLKFDESMRQAVQARYHYVLVDEFQDTNRLQYEILKLLMGNDNLTVIGDPNQSIYGFRGASGTIFQEFKRDFPNHLAITLGTNYRSVPAVVKLSNALFEHAPNQRAHSEASGLARAVQVLNEYSEAQWVLGEIQRAIGGGDFLKAVSDDQRHQHRRLSDFAVLYRSRPAAVAFHKLLAESGLPYQVVGDGSPYDQPEVQALVALLRAANGGEPVEMQGYTRVQRPAPYGAGQRRLLEQELTSAAAAAPSALAERLMAILGLEPNRELQQFVGSLVRFKDVAAALSYIDSIAEQAFYDPDAEAITLLTIHASKGLEFPVVFLIGAEEGILPSERADPAEERRLLYVAVTRARERLELLHAKQRGGRPAKISRFIAELPADVLERLVDPGMPDQVRRLAKRVAKKSQQSLF